MFPPVIAAIIDGPCPRCGDPHLVRQREVPDFQCMNCDFPCMPDGHRGWFERSQESFFCIECSCGWHACAGHDAFLMSPHDLADRCIAAAIHTYECAKPELRVNEELSPENLGLTSEQVEQGWAASRAQTKARQRRRRAREKQEQR